MIKIGTGDNTPEASAARFRRAAQEVGPEGLEARITEGVAQLVRFASANVEVRTSRTKNSIYGKVEGGQGVVRGIVGATSSYHPYVRDAGHGVQFLRHAAQKELPLVLKNIGQDVVASVQEAFE